MKYNTFTLSNGLRIIHLPSTAPVVYCGYQINAGSRNEDAGEEGLAHFCEHTTFKGTQRRHALEILNCLESVGGDLNAFTNKEDTTYYAAILKDHMPRAVDLLTDIVFHSTYPQQEIDKEVEVICDEIESYNDSPAELIYDEFENLIFRGHPLGHNILGTADRVRGYTTADALRFTHRYYRPDNAIFFAYGDVDFHRLVRLLDKATKDLSAQKGADQDRLLLSAASSSSTTSATSSEALRQKEEEEKNDAGDLQRQKDEKAENVSESKLRQKDELLPGNTYIIDKQTHQAHVMVGNKAYDVHDNRRIALYLLNNIIGGPGMNAKLNLALRERNGLVYTVESTMVSYGDTGIWSVYFGCDEHDIKRCLRLTRGVVEKFIDQPLTERQLHAAKKQIKGQIGVACDNRENFALDFGKSFLHYGWEKDVTALYEKIDAVTAEQIQQVATDVMAPEKWTTLIYK